MTKIYLLVTALVASLVSMAQPMLTPTVISSTGGFSSNANGSLSYTVGEMTMVQTFSANGSILTQGFQQPQDMTVGLVDLAQDEFGSFVIYPNPAVDNASFGFKFSEQGKVSIVLYNELGQKLSDVYSTNYDAAGTIVQPLNVSQYASGMYFLQLNFVGTKDGKEHTMSKKFQVIR